MEDRDLKSKNDLEVNSVLSSIQENKSLDTTSKNYLYNRVKSIIDHNFWYTKEQITKVRDAALSSTLFTFKQKAQLRVSSIREQWQDEYEDGCPDGMTHDEWDEYMERQS